MQWPATIAYRQACDVELTSGSRKIRWQVWLAPLSSKHRLVASRAPFCLVHQTRTTANARAPGWPSKQEAERSWELASSVHRVDTPAPCRPCTTVATYQSVALQEPYAISVARLSMSGDLAPWDLHVRSVLTGTAPIHACMYFQRHVNQPSNHMRSAPQPRLARDAQRLSANLNPWGIRNS
ncbi:uncharacterized protein LY79DRAFT_325840 [Colletotrichum navitas]|uniref:Uncharacterized protein n=1 Tax=Colletotrichum navitas TaxID=681940 RepID=A0AAD8Q9Q3_9PEZI|nr:uncharacterized protein LY79DRAFT_325840 [Colletotrichum navitas]KAK1598016.1 hypothetical protein LY79DRAFT_325840 [Colletotrichum navitas]